MDYSPREHPPTAPQGDSDDTPPIDVAPGFEYLNPAPGKLKETDGMFSAVRRHQRLQEEPRDPAWSERMEAALRAAIEGELTAKGLDTHRVEMPVVECRSTGCEIQAYGFVEDNRNEAADFQLIMFRVIGGRLGDEFDRDAFAMNVTSPVAGSDGRITFLAQLPRKVK